MRSGSHAPNVDLSIVEQRQVNMLAQVGNIGLRQ
jgi:hypothetical protein